MLSKPDTTIPAEFKERFKQKKKVDYLEKDQVNTIFAELDDAIKLNEENLTSAKTSKYSEGKLRKLINYRYYLKFILHAGVRAGDECFLIKWSDFSIDPLKDKNGKDVIWTSQISLDSL